MNRDEALGLPPSSVRAILTLTLVVSTVALVIITGQVPPELMLLTGIAVRDYFEKKKAV